MKTINIIKNNFNNGVRNGVIIYEDFQDLDYHSLKSTIKRQYFKNNELHGIQKRYNSENELIELNYFENGNLIAKYENKILIIYKLEFYEIIFRIIKLLKIKL